ncbi:MAG: hypothetical protein OXI82_00120, partial [Nitrospinae bacterium]|nr:hypothetical protein [Nitrospinota bacterium]
RAHLLFNADLIQVVHALENLLPTARFRPVLRAPKNRIGATQAGGNLNNFLYHKSAAIENENNDLRLLPAACKPPRLQGGILSFLPIALEVSFVENGGVFVPGRVSSLK